MKRVECAGTAMRLAEQATLGGAGAEAAIKAAALFSIAAAIEDLAAAIREGNKKP